MADTPKAYKLNKEKRAAEENGKFLYYFYDRKRLTSVALPEEQFDKLVEMDREYYNLERRENDHKTTFKKSANANGYKKIDIEKDDFGQASGGEPDNDDVSARTLPIKFTSNAISIKKLPRFRLTIGRFTKCIMWTVSDRRKLRKNSEKRKVTSQNG